MNDWNSGCGACGPRLELGVELAADEVRVVRQLDHLDQPAGRATAPESTMPWLLERLAVVVVDLVAVAVALADLGRRRRPSAARDARRRARTGYAPRRIVAALVGDVALVGHQVDDRVRRAPDRTRSSSRPSRPHDVARELDHRHLHAEADAEERHASSRARSGWRRSCPRCRARRSRARPGCRRRRRAAASAPRFSISSESMWWRSTRQSLRDAAVDAAPR